LENEAGWSTRGGSRSKRSTERVEKRISTVEEAGIPKIEEDREEEC